MNKLGKTQFARVKYGKVMKKANYELENEGTGVGLEALYEQQVDRGEAWRGINVNELQDKF